LLDATPADGLGTDVDSRRWACQSRVVRALVVARDDLDVAPGLDAARPQRAIDRRQQVVFRDEQTCRRCDDDLLDEPLGRRRLKHVRRGAGIFRHLGEGEAPQTHAPSRARQPEIGQPAMSATDEVAPRHIADHCIVRHHLIAPPRAMAIRHQPDRRQGVDPRQRRVGRLVAVTEHASKLTVAQPGRDVRRIGDETEDEAQITRVDGVGHAAKQFFERGRGVRAGGSEHEEGDRPPRDPLLLAVAVRPIASPARRGREANLLDRLADHCHRLRGHARVRVEDARDRGGRDTSDLCDTPHRHAKAPSD
jgi:hypothetical protein